MEDDRPIKKSANEESKNIKKIVKEALDKYHPDEAFQKALEARKKKKIEQIKNIEKISKEEEENEEDPFSFLNKGNLPSENENKNPIIKVTKYEKSKNKWYLERPDTDTGCIRFYYPTYEEFISKNLPCIKRPWPGGREGFNDATEYKPGNMYNYVQDWYVDYFEKNGISSPFKYNEDNISKGFEQICNNKEYTLQPHQKFIGAHMSNMTDFGGLLCSQNLGSGKCMGINTPVLMFDGSIKMCQDVVVGDLLMGDDSKPRKVLSLGRGRDVMYEVVPSNGETYTFNSEHILSLKCTNIGICYQRDVKRRQLDGTEKIELIDRWIARWFNNKTIKIQSKYFQTQQEAENFLDQFDEESKKCNITIREFLKLPKGMQTKLKLYRVPIEFPSKEVPIHPYIIGYWIGDGNSTGSCFTSQESEVIGYLANKLPEYDCYLKFYNTNTSSNYRMNGTGKINGNHVTNILKELDLINNKHIPDIYKINSREVRLNILAGILDADGYLNKNGYFEFCQKSEKIMDDVIYIARSLGFSAYKSIKKTSWTYKGIKKHGTAFRCCINGNIDEIPCKIPNKQAKPRHQRKDILVTAFNLVEKPINNYYGFTLDSNHLYVLGNFTVTHNTCTGIIVAEANKGRYFKEDKIKIREGSTIPQKLHSGNYDPNMPEKPCHITVVIPKQTIGQYLEEIRGSIENGLIKSCTGSCIYTEADQDDSEYVKMRQYYSGFINNKGEYDLKDLRELSIIETSISELENERNFLMEQQSGENTQNKKEIQQQIQEKSMEINNKESQKQKIIKRLDKKISDVYFIVSQETFLSKITTKIKGSYVASPYIYGALDSELPHPDCFHSKKSVVIIDEVHKLTGTVNYFRLYDTLMINARDRFDGTPAMKVILFTATPIFDVPHEASLIVNLLRPRIPFPLAEITFNDFFIDFSEGQDSLKIKNKLCYQYLSSGYVAYSRGANPKGFPLRRNFIKLHEMSHLQLEGYIQLLKSDVKKDSNSKQTENSEVKFYDETYRLKDKYSNKMEDDNQQKGTYIKSRLLCNIYLPGNKLNKTSRDEYDPGQGEIDAKNGYNNLKKILQSKQSAQEILSTFRNYSPKFHSVIESILNSKDEGPIVVYTEWIWYGVMSMTMVLDLLGWEFIRPDSSFNNDKNTKRYGIWSPGALTELGISGSKQSAYTSKLQKINNSSLNKMGELCKVVFITVNEGISLKRACQMHVTSPWWNESRTRQIIGRVERFCSHSDLKEERQYVDVYYHCSVLDTFKNYPRINTVVDNALKDAVFKEEQKPSGVFNFRDLARLTVEQRVFIAARRKTEINTQFENAIKETAIDWQLNKYGNLIRLEEVNFPLHSNGKSYLSVPGLNSEDKILYDKSENLHYVYKNKKLYNLELNKKGEDGKSIWPVLSGTIGNYIDPEKNWEQHEISEIINNKNQKMISYIITENIDSFNNNPKIKDKNFKELMNYAVNVKKEELHVWEYFEDRRVRNKLFEILVSLYRLSDGQGSRELQENFHDRILASEGSHKETRDKILQENANKELMIELAHKTKDPQLKKNIISIVPKLEDRSKFELSKDKAEGKWLRLKTLFFKTSDEKLELMKNILVDKFHLTYADLDNRAPSELVSMYHDHIEADKNRKKR